MQIRTKLKVFNKAFYQKQRRSKNRCNAFVMHIMEKLKNLGGNINVDTFVKIFCDLPDNPLFSWYNKFYSI